MQLRFWNYITVLFYSVPLYIYIVLFLIAVLGVTLFLVRKGKDAGVYIARLLSTDYVVYIFCSTVLFREECQERISHLKPFWSYGSSDIFDEAIMNVLVFIPLGFFLGWSLCEKYFAKAVMIGFFVTIMVELMQFVFKRGTAETDDIIHNTLGCLVGVTAALVLRKYITRHKNTYFQSFDFDGEPSLEREEKSC